MYSTVQHCSTTCCCLRLRCINVQYGTALLYHMLLPQASSYQCTSHASLCEPSLCVMASLAHTCVLLLPIPWTAADAAFSTLLPPSHTSAALCAASSPQSHTACVLTPRMIQKMKSTRIYTYLLEFMIHQKYNPKYEYLLGIVRVFGFPDLMRCDENC